MAYKYYIRYYHGHTSSAESSDVLVYTATTANIVGARFTTANPNVYGDSYIRAGKSKNIKYKALNRSGQDTLGISWTVAEPIFQHYLEDEWSSFSGSTSVYIADLNWQRNADSTEDTIFIHPTYRVLDGSEYVQLSLPATYEFNGFYSTADITYLTVDYGYNKDPKKISLNSQVYSRVTISKWLTGEGDEWTPGSPVLVSTGIVADTYSGPYSSITYHTRSDAKTYKELLSSIDTTRPEEDCSFEVTLRSDPATLHVSETLNVAAYKQYTFNTWKTSSGTLDLTKKPTSDVTVYADWTHTDTVVRTAFPQWTTDQLLPYGSDPIRYVTLRCYKKAQGDEYYSKQFGVYVSKQGKHVKWSDGNSEYLIASTVPLNEGAEYTAVWEADASAEAVEGIPGNTIQIPDPPQRLGYTYLGVTSSETSKVPDYDPGATIRVESDTNLWAVWKANGSGHLFDGTSYKLYQIYIYDGNNWKLYLPKIYNGTDWDTVYM